MVSVKKAVILAGGMGTRIAEETSVRPKPLIEIGGLPILWHIMKIFHAHGVNDFVICLGYKGYLIKEYFSNYFLHQSDVTFNFDDNSILYHKKRAENWTVTLVDTGAETMTGGRVKRIQDYIGNEPFCLTYGDGVGNIDIGALLDFHAAHGKLATITAVSPPGRFGALNFDSGDGVTSFQEKPDGELGWINGGFFVLSPEVFKYIEGDATIWEREPLEGLARDGQLSAYKHHGFWHPMDTLRDKQYLEQLWTSSKAPWKIW
ncbi:glucose-1-phosphate cytidylyltransferase [Rhodopseudomonas palustris]|uniref:glucose-1-phosphate cytidylyltransferase n=1 Tax=Rhodopseudomonas palustris TaxID=1076 RepID=UPI002ACE0587|nr:glucose-1-phosphate cytidylyltransferase [Rhodopseudomonas palustris]WQG97482.1 glucose-1-phosphate cytidylyltransferase [Rhodopseudomonas palustris]